MNKSTKQTSKTLKFCRAIIDVGTTGAKFSTFALLICAGITTFAAVVGDCYEKKKQKQKINTFNQQFKRA